MIAFLSVTWELLINLFEIIIFYFYINSVLTPKFIHNGKLFQFLLLFIRFICITIGNVLGLPPFYTIAFALIFNVIFANILFMDKPLRCFFWPALHILIAISSELISYMLLNVFTPMLPDEIMYGEAFRFPCTTLYIICYAALSFGVSIFNTREMFFSLGQKSFIFFTMIIGIIITHCFMYIMIALKPEDSELMNITILANFVFLCFFILLLVYVYQLAIKQYEYQELQEKTKLLELEESQYNNLLSTTESLRTIKHDIHHHLLTIQSLIAHKDFARLETYLEEYKTHFDLDYMSASSGNLVVDSILSTKLHLAKQHHINLEYSVHMSNNSPFTDVELSALLGNLFDNAIEACRHVVNEQRWIRFEMKPYESMLVIHIENSYDGIIKQSSKHVFLSRKPSTGHGLGLSRVKNLVDNANGFTDIRYDTNTFIVHIIIPLESEHEH